MKGTGRPVRSLAERCARLLFLLALAGLAGCAGSGAEFEEAHSQVAVLEGGVGGTGLTGWGGDEEEGGIGGTGVVAGTLDEGGLGGTGVVSHSPEEGGVGGTGIIGVITGFGSIVVNGIHIEIDPSVPVFSQLAEQSVGSDALQVGHLVEVDAESQAGRYGARSVTLRHLLAGTVAAFDGEAGLMRVGSQRVSLEEGTRIDSDAVLEPGGRVAVSGLWSGAVLQATRIERYTGEEDLIAGPLQRAAHGGLQIGEQPLSLEGESAQPEGMEGGREVVLRGRFSADRDFSAARWRLRPPVPFGGRLPELIMERVAKPGPGSGVDGRRATHREVVRGRVRGPGEWSIEEVRPTRHLDQGAPIRPMKRGAGTFRPPSGHPNRGDIHPQPTGRMERGGSPPREHRLPPAHHSPRRAIVPPPPPERHPPMREFRPHFGDGPGRGGRR